MINRGGVLPLSGTEPDVPAAHGKTIGLSNDRAGEKADVQVHQSQQALDNHTLLVILLAHKELVGVDDAQEPVHDLADTLEMSRPVLAFQQGLEGTQIIVLEVSGPTRVELCHPWQEEDVDTGGFEQGNIFLERNGIFLEVFGVVELRWVDKNAANGDIRLKI